MDSLFGDLGIQCRRLSFAGGGRPSEGLEREQLKVATAIGALPKLPLVLVGRSFGGRVCGRLAVKLPPAALVLLGFPLAPGRKLRTEDAEALSSLTCPTLIVQGDADPLGPVDLLRKVTRTNKAIALKVLKGTGHAFDTQARTRAVLEATEHFVLRHL